MQNSKCISFPSSVLCFLESWTIRKQREEELIALSCGAGEDCYEYHGLQEEQTNQLLNKLKLQTTRSINKEATTVIVRTYHAKRK